MGERLIRARPFMVSSRRGYVIEPLHLWTHQGTMQRTIHQIKLMLVSCGRRMGRSPSIFYSLQPHARGLYIMGVRL
jgi:hypothetical protein